MITSINKNNNATYQNYFNEVSEYLFTHDESGLKLEKEDYNKASIAQVPDEEYNTIYDDETKEYTFITSLEELFGWMQKLRAIRPQLTKLPLDEPCFEIDANTRVIDIPSQFTKDGIFSVEGDEIAESVYFRINRFYDHMDLNTQHILIQYRNAKGQEFASMPPMVDVESDPGFIIFEWPISSKVTAAAGNVEFSVRFFDYDDTTLDEDGHGKITYSLSTLPKTIAIKSSQNFDLVSLNEEESSLKENKKELMIERLKREPLYGPNVSKAEKPIFWDDFKLGPVMYLKENPKTGYYSDPIEVQVQAYSESGHISYSWSKKLLDGTSVALTPKTKMIQTQDSTPKAGKIYYLAIKEGERVVGYNKQNSITNFVEDKSEYYEKVSYVEFDSVGYYQAKAENQVGTALAFAQTPVEMVDGVETESWCLVPFPQEQSAVPIESSVVLTFDDVADKFVGEIKNAENNKSLDEFGKLSFQWYYSPDGEAEYTKIGEETGDSKLVLQGDSVLMEIYDEDGNLVEDPGPDAEIIETVQYEDGDTAVVETITSTGNGAYGTDNETGKKGVFVPAIENDIPSGDGYYKVKVINHLNNQFNASKLEDLEPCRVTHPAIKPDFEIVDEESKFTVSKDLRYQITKASALSNGIEVKALIPDFAKEQRTNEDTLEFQWFRYSSDIKDDIKYLEQLNKDSKNAYNGRYVLDNDFRVKDNEAVVINDTKDKTATSKIYLKEEVLNKGNYFFCRVMNVYNGSKATRCSVIFEVVNK